MHPLVTFTRHVKRSVKDLIANYTQCYTTEVETKNLLDENTCVTEMVLSGTQFIVPFVEVNTFNNNFTGELPIRSS